MRLVFLVLSFFIITGIHNVYSQHSSIIFTSDEDCKFVVYKPVDGFYNQYYPTDTVGLHPGSEVIFPLAIDDWSIVKCAQQKKIAIDIFIEKDSIVRIHNMENGIRFEGSNAAANELMYNSSVFRMLNLGSTLDSLFQIKDVNNIEKIINNTRLLPQTAFLYTSLDSLFANKEISEKCYHYCIKEIDYQFKNGILNRFYREINNFKPMTDTIRNYVLLTGKTFFDDGKIANYINGKMMNSFYCAFLFNQLGNSAKDSLREGLSKETIGPHSRYLLSKGITQLAQFFEAFIIQYSYGFNEFDRVEMYNYLKSKFPESEAVRIIGKLVEDELSDASLGKPIFLKGDSIANFSYLKNLDSLQNKYIFVDLWASWCMPCRAEFFHNKALNALLANYQNIEKIYLSVDENQKSWEDAIKALKLSGYQMLASEKLVTFLKKEIYKNKAISIPRYLLLDPQGNILNDDLARPSEIDNLKQQLDKYLK